MRDICAGHTPLRGTHIPADVERHAPRENGLAGRCGSQSPGDNPDPDGARSSSSRGFFGNPPEKADAAVRVEEDSEKEVSGGLVGPGGIGRTDSTPGGTRTGNGEREDGDGDVCPDGWGTYVPAGGGECG